jgi:hypothetical protein
MEYKVQEHIVSPNELALTTQRFLIRKEKHWPSIFCPFNQCEVVGQIFSTHTSLHCKGNSYSASSRSAA